MERVKGARECVCKRERGERERGEREGERGWR
jgi:hypothetical protein